MDKKDIVPFLKWAGGKRWLTNTCPEIFPQSISRFVEPFLGSGAVFFSLRPDNAILSDSNLALIETYNALKTDHELVVRYLREHQNKHSKSHYYEVRSSKPRSPSRKAARFIYLNRTCWNALYRVNLKGQFNVPIGTKSTVILPSDNFKRISEVLQDATILHSDFESIIDETIPGDFLFLDPPYTAKHNHNGFLKYNETIFSWDDQIRLRDSLKRASSRGVKFLMTNANHGSVNDLYPESFCKSEVSRHSLIAAFSKNREKISELLISNY